MAYCNQEKEIMQKLYSNILETIGSTPIVKLNSFKHKNSWVKLEYFNPAGSAKDRVAYSMLTRALDAGEITKETPIIEPTSGNTGIALAMCAGVLGMKFIAVMPENMSKERVKLIKAYGAEIVLTPAKEGMQGSVQKAQELKKELNGFIPMQFENKNNPYAHYVGTAEEIFEQTEGKIDVLIAAIGTGGTISGCAKKLKELKPEIKIFGVEAAESPLLTKGYAGAHKIQGISANFVPKTLDLEIIDEIIDIKGDEAIKASRQIAKEEGILVGISSGAVLCAIKEIGQKYQDKMIVGVLCDSGERYLSSELYE